MLGICHAQDSQADRNTLAHHTTDTPAIREMELWASLAIRHA
jgi:hypothetical protein